MGFGVNGLFDVLSFTLFDEEERAREYSRTKLQWLTVGIIMEVDHVEPLLIESIR